MSRVPPSFHIQNEHQGNDPKVALSRLQRDRHFLEPRLTLLRAGSDCTYYFTELSSVSQYVKIQTAQ